MRNYLLCNTCGRTFAGLTDEALAHMIECHALVTAVQDRERSRWREQYNAMHRAAYWRNPEHYRARQNERKREQRAIKRESA